MVHLGKELEFLPTLLSMVGKYDNIDATDISILVEKFNDGVVLTVKGKDTKLGDMLAELLVSIAKMSAKEDNPLKLTIENNRD